MQALAFMIVAALPTFGLTATTQEKDVKKTDKTEINKPEVKGAELGKAAPDFELKDQDGKTVRLSDYKDKIVVLEWFNPECPFVVYAHSEGNLKDLAARSEKEGVVWLAVNSGAPGKQGNGVEKNKKIREEWKMGHPILMDEAGEVGMKYGAKTTPHMFIIDTKGMLVYRGALDNTPNGKAEGDAKPINYVEAAIAELKANKPVATKDTKSYGCSVKYGVKL